MTGVCLETNPEVLRTLLEVALKQLSLYAKELNSKDGGNRKEYDSIEQWKVDASN